MPCKAKGKVVAERGLKPRSLLLPPHTVSFRALKITEMGTPSKTSRTSWKMCHERKRGQAVHTRSSFCPLALCPHSLWG